MTIQVQTHNKSKAVLQEALNSNPVAVRFYDPSFMNPHSFTGDDIPKGTTYLPVVMDHPRRSRFAEIARKLDGTFKVK